MLPRPLEDRLARTFNVCIAWKNEIYAALMRSQDIVFRKKKKKLVCATSEGRIQFQIVTQDNNYLVDCKMKKQTVQSFKQ